MAEEGKNQHNFTLFLKYFNENTKNSRKIESV
jgi:hypothetical protein